MLAWIDLETTSLVVTEHAVLEVAAIVTDDRLREVGRFHRVVHWPLAELLAHLGPDSPEEALALGAAATRIDPVVVKMHAKNRLWSESARSPHHLANVDDQLAEFFAQHAAPAPAPASTPTDAAAMQIAPAPMPTDATEMQIAGSSIWFDRMLMAVSLPRSLRKLHYRCIDVSTLNELARRFWPRLHGQKPSRREIHRAVPDIEDSLALCRYYVEQIEAPPNGGAAR